MEFGKRRNKRAKKDCVLSEGHGGENEASDDEAHDEHGCRTFERLFALAAELNVSYLAAKGDTDEGS